jgi:hypothetical protein
MPITNGAPWLEKIKSSGRKAIAIGKKNWLFAGSERAGRRAAAIRSLFATAKLNGLDPARCDAAAERPAMPDRQSRQRARLTVQNRGLI